MLTEFLGEVDTLLAKVATLTLPLYCKAKEANLHVGTNYFQIISTDQSILKTDVLWIQLTSIFLLPFTCYNDHTPVKGYTEFKKDLESMLTVCRSR